MKKGYLLLLIGAIPAIGFGTLAAFNRTNAAETSETSETLQTRHYKIDLQTLVAETQKIIPTLSTYGQSWRVVESETKNDSAIIKVEVPVLIFVDDLEISAVKKVEKDEIIVNARSASRIGNSDFGENRRHISQLLNALDEKFDRHF